MKRTLIKLLILSVSMLFTALVVSCVDETETGSGISSSLTISITEGTGIPEETSASKAGNDTDQGQGSSIQNSTVISGTEPGSEPGSDSNSNTETYSDPYREIIDDLDELEQIINELDDLTSEDLAIPES